MTDRDFWRAVYVAAIRAGQSDEQAQQAANTGVLQSPKGLPAFTITTTATAPVPIAPRHGEPFKSDGAPLRCPLGHLMRYDIEDDRFHCDCGAVASANGAIIVDPDPVVVAHV